MNDWEKHVGRGWQPIVKKTVNSINALGATVRQVKEKFGGLRIYYDSESNHGEINRLIQEAEWECEKICEECGEPGTLDSNRGWLKTLCPKHRSPQQ